VVARPSRRKRAEPGAAPDAPPGMSADLRIQGATAAGASRGTSSQAGDAAFDRWLQRELSRLYDDALSEPVPEDLLKLLGGADTKPG